MSAHVAANTLAAVTCLPLQQLLSCRATAAGQALYSVHCCVPCRQVMVSGTGQPGQQYACSSELSAPCSFCGAQQLHWSAQLLHTSHRTLFSIYAVYLAQGM